MKSPESLHAYRAYGLTLSSVLSFPELPELSHVDEEKADVMIRYGDVPESLPDAARRGPYFMAAPGRVLFTFAGEVRLLVNGGRKILIDPACGADDDFIRMFLLGSSMAAVFHSRNLLPLHGNCFQIEGATITCLGRQGAGKSTLAAAALKNGCSILTDDICLLAGVDEGNPLVIPSYPQLKLNRDSLRIIGCGEAGLRALPREDGKFAFPVGNAYQPEPAALDVVYVIEHHDGPDLEIVPVAGKEKVFLLMANTYRKKLLHGMGRGEAHFHMCRQIAKTVAVCRIRRPSAGFPPGDLVDVIGNDVKKRILKA